jgi:hypothetical protein
MGVIDCFSTNVLEITAALSAVNKIVTEDMIPAVIGDVSITQLSFPFSERFGIHGSACVAAGVETFAARNGSGAQEGRWRHAQVRCGHILRVLVRDSACCARL